MRSSYNMLSTMQDDGAKTMKAEMEKNALSHVERRRGNLFKNGLHVRPVLGESYVPHPAPGSSIVQMRSIMRTPGTPSTGSRVKMDASVKPIMLDNLAAPSTEYLQGEEWGMDFNEISTPRTKWRNQFWNKRTPWAADRRVFTGTSTYLTSLKPSARNYNSTTRWECGDEGQPLARSSEDIVRQIVYKLEQHCNSTFALGRAFKFFDRDNSSTIDVDEMRACLVTFSIEVTDDELHSIMEDFGAELDEKGQKTIRYRHFVAAVEQLGGRHPLKINTGRFIKSLRSTFMRDPEGRRLCTPGFKSPVGCPDSGCYYPEHSPFAREQPRSQSVAF